MPDPPLWAGTTLSVRRRQISADGTLKLLLTLPDKNTVECVSMSMPQTRSMCISTQVGCPIGCTFCQTGRSGFIRNLTGDEIMAQARTLARESYLRLNSWPTRCVFMGMGEPLLNFDALCHSLRSLTEGPTAHLSWRKILVSTVGIPDRLKELGRLRLALPAISLHAPTQELRDRLIPGAKKWPLTELLQALRTYPLPGRERITIEYILISDVNDSDKHARQLHVALQDIRCKVNLIPCNPVIGNHWTPSSHERVSQFAQQLKISGMTVFVRRGLGPEILAACGQLQAAENGSGSLIPAATNSLHDMERK